MVEDLPLPLSLESRARGGGSKTQRAVQAALAGLSPRLLVSLRARRSVSRMVENWVLVVERGVPRGRVSRMLGVPLAEAFEGGQAVDASLDHLDLVDHPFGVAVGGRLVEVGE